MCFAEFVANQTQEIFQLGDERIEQHIVQLARLVWQSAGVKLVDDAFGMGVVAVDNGDFGGRDAAVEMRLHFVGNKYGFVQGIWQGYNARQRTVFFSFCGGLKLGVFASQALRIA